MLRQVLLLAMASMTLAAVARLPLEEKPAEYQDCDGCWVSAIQQFIPIGESVPSPTKCEEYRCNEKEVLIISCGTVAVVEPCYIEEDPSLPYPNCCPRGVCPK